MRLIAFREVVEACGTVAMIPQKTRVVFLVKIVRHGPATYTHSFRAHDASFFDAAFAALLHESYIRGRQEHLPAKLR